MMVTNYMDPAIAGRDFNTASTMLANGDALFFIMGDWQIGILDRGGLQAGTTRLCLRPGADRLGQARVHPQLELGRVLRAERPGLHRGPEAPGAA